MTHFEKACRMLIAKTRLAIFKKSLPATQGIRRIQDLENLIMRHKTANERTPENG